MRALADDVVGKAEGKKKVMVLGGTGFVGQEICKQALEAGFDVVAVSRRGVPEGGGLAGVDYRAVDVIDNAAAVEAMLVAENFSGVVHAVGMLLANDLNRFASGSGSVPRPGTTYDQVTRQTALSAAASFAAASAGLARPGPPFVFVSAAEAGWTTDPPFTPPFLTEYLIAKRAVEQTLLNDYNANALRPVILRPSLVYEVSLPKLASLPPVAAFILGNALGIPGVDRPVLVSTLAAAAVKGLMDDSVYGIQNYEGMERLAGI